MAIQAGFKMKSFGLPKSRILSVVIVCFAAVSCVEETPCDDQRVVVTDIDETLTTGDEEWMMQLFDETHDPAMRPDANTLMNWYADNGYAIVYITARGEDLLLPDYTPAREATQNWLVAHEFPYEEGNLYLGEGALITGDEAIAYKAGVIEALIEEGWTVDYAYGNAETDIEAFFQAGIGTDRIYLVGELAGTMGVEPLIDDEAYTQHIEDHLPNVPSAHCD